MKTKERLTLRSVCFALLLTAVALRLAMMLGGRDGQAVALFLGLGLLPDEADPAAASSEALDAPTVSPTFPPLEYRRRRSCCVFRRRMQRWWTSPTIPARTSTRRRSSRSRFPSI